MVLLKGLEYPGHREAGKHCHNELDHLMKKHSVLVFKHVQTLRNGVFPAQLLSQVYNWQRQI
jgi:hypothetical protein